MCVEELAGFGRCMWTRVTIMRESNATINSYFFSSTHDGKTTLQNMGRGTLVTNGMLRDREYNNEDDGKNTVATVRDTMRDMREENETRQRKRETTSMPFTSSWLPFPPTW